MKMAVFWVVVLCRLVQVYQSTQHYTSEDSYLHGNGILYSIKTENSFTS
jgi:hypothetical protein